MSLSQSERLQILDDALTTVEGEYTDHPLPVEGTLPPTLEGVLFRNGGGRFERGGQRYGHPFDGDGHVCRIELGGGSAHYTNRFVRTEELLAEEAAGHMRYRGFGTQLPGGLAANLFRRLKNAANTNVIWHAGRLLALWEGGLPHELDPRTLATLGPYDYRGRLRIPARPPLSWRASALPFSAHPHIDADTGELINFGIMFGSPNQLMLYRVTAEGEMARPEPYALPRFSFVHDIVVTRRWICALLPHADFRVAQALIGLRSPIASLKLATERPMQALLIPRQGGSMQILEAVPGFVFHIAQACDREDGTLAIDAVRYRRFPTLDELDEPSGGGRTYTTPRLERLILDPSSRRCSAEPWSERGFELPTTAPGPLGVVHGAVYGVGAERDSVIPFFNAIQRLDIETGELKVLDFGRDLPGEPVFATGGSPDRRKDEDGWLLTLLHRTGGERSELLVLHAEDLSVQARLQLPHVVPPGFHGCWVERRAMPERSEPEIAS